MTQNIVQNLPTEKKTASLPLLDPVTQGEANKKKTPPVPEKTSVRKSPTLYTAVDNSGEKSPKVDKIPEKETPVLLVILVALIRGLVGGGGWEIGRVEVLSGAFLIKLAG